MIVMPDTADGNYAHQALVNRYHEFLSAPRIAELTHKQLVTGQRSLGLMYGDRPMTRVLRPRLMPAAEHQSVAERGRLVARAARRLASHLLSPGGGLPAAVRDSVVLDPIERALARVPGPGEEAGLIGRLDGFGSGQEVRFVEYNADSCACVIVQEQLAGIYTSTAALRGLSESVSLQPVPMLERVVDLLLSAWHAAGEPGANPSVAVVDWPEGAWAGEFDLVCSAFRDRGVPALVCTPDDLSFSRGKLTARISEGRRCPVTLVYRRVPVFELYRRLGPDVLSHPLVKAVATGACAVVNPLAAGLSQRKAVFGLLSDERVQSWLPDDEAAAVLRHVPWSRSVRPGRVLYQAEDVDLLQFAHEHRNRLVLKPDNAGAGYGVLCGWETSPSSWDAALGRALLTPHVLQERVRAPTAEYPLLINGRLSFHRLIEGTDPMLLGDLVTGCLTRISTNAVINVSAGGELLPVFTATLPPRDRLIDPARAKRP
ncbi:hypothetical protein [Streptomyces sp. SCL15-4]|uniref:hypothetical protein n=1 Tax=Streptomyces sp. SCL15-4 TaxID=2967221 RepID=UPI0029671A33|nr:hypothetical protein [Streptomyces sp. SCL15-4]